ncbi:MAG: rRNA pseudouridine synthase [Oscillospiraceae bacterium]|nr:rRNA pseudouridine synthase [Oscillospiraceae bacterium]
MERLDKFLVECGIGSRSQVKNILKSGAVTVDGVVQKDGAVKIDPGKQEILYAGEALQGKRRVVAMLHKPAGFVTATEDKQERTVMELLPPELARQDIKPVGRLDKETEGLLLFTNDGDLLHRLISPKKEVPKVYYARHEGQATQDDVKAFADGLTLRDGTVCRSAALEPIGAGESRITVCEGKYHQVRRMMASRGMTVLYLKREREGCLELGALALGEVRELTAREITELDNECR